MIDLQQVANLMVKYQKNKDASSKHLNAYLVWQESANAIIDQLHEVLLNEIEDQEGEEK